MGCMWHACPSNGLHFNDDGVVDRVVNGSPAERGGQPGDRLVAPLPYGLDRDPPQTLSFDLAHGGTVRHVILTPVPADMTSSGKLRLSALLVSDLISVIVGSGLLWLRPSAMTWSFYLYCILRRYGDLFFYWPGSSAFFWLISWLSVRWAEPAARWS